MAVELRKNTESVRRNGAVVVAFFALIVSLYVAARRDDERSAQDTHGQTGLLYSLASDPTAGAGIGAPLWQLLVRTDVPSVYYKSGTSSTAWTLLGSSLPGGLTAVYRDAPLAGSGTSPSHLALTKSGNFRVTGGTTLDLATSIAVSGGVAADTGTFTTSMATGTVTCTEADYGIGGAGQASLVTSAGSPNGSVSASKGSIDSDITNGAVYVNTNGGNAWSKLLSGTVAAARFDTVCTVNITGAGVGSIVKNDWAPCTLGQNTLVVSGCQNVGFACNLTGIAGGVDGITVTVISNADVATGHINFKQDTATSAAANRFLNQGNNDSGGSVNWSQTYIYIGALSRWVALSTNPAS